jgi:hypothetical protein
MHSERAIIPIDLSAIINSAALLHHAPPKSTNATMADEEDIAALVIDNGSGMCKGGSFIAL